jgi:hypothetical protein
MVNGGFGAAVRTHGTCHAIGSWGLGLRIADCGFGIWNLEFGIWDLGFGIVQSLVQL